MDAELLHLPNADFDAVVSLCAVLHFPQIANAMDEMYRVVRPGGRLVVSFGRGKPIDPDNAGGGKREYPISQLFLIIIFGTKVNVIS